MKSFAKINLLLHILGRRKDGFHEIETVFQPIELHDNVLVKKAVRGIRISCSNPLVPPNEKNIAFKAVEKLAEYNGIDLEERGVEIFIEKNIPVAGGLGGSASNAVPVLIQLNKLWKLGLSKEELMEVGAALGADVKALFYKKPVLGRGKGNELIELERMPLKWIVVVVPRIHYFEKEAMKKSKVALLYLAAEKIVREEKRRSKLARMLDGIKEKDWCKVADNLSNDFEEVAFKQHPLLEEIRNEFIEMNAMGAGLAGSGPSLYAIAETKSSAKKIFVEMKKKNVGQTILTKTI